MHQFVVNNFILLLVVHSFVEMVPKLLAIPGVRCVLSDKLNQDPLEEHFGRQRSRGGANDNPTLEDYGRNERKIQVMKTTMIKVVRGNTRGRAGDQEPINIHDMSSLPKRQKK